MIFGYFLKIGIFVLLLVGGNCAQDGESGGGPPAKGPVETEPEPPLLPLKTSIPFDAMTYRSPQASDCFERIAPAVIGPAPPDFVLDGSLVEWDAVAPVIVDPQGDAPADLDLQSVHIASFEGKLIVATPLALALDATFEVTLGGILTKPNSMESVTSVVLRVEERQLFEIRRDGSKRSLSSEEGELRFGDNGFEMAIGERFWNLVTPLPIWWLHVAAAAEAGVDRLNSAYFVNHLGLDNPRFMASGCVRWTGRRSQAVLGLLTDQRPELNLDPLRLRSLEEYVASLARAALEDVERHYGPLPFARLTLLTSAKRGEIVGAEASMLPYAAFHVDLREFVTGAYSERAGVDFYHELVSFLIDAKLRTSTDFDSLSTRIVARHALTLGIIQEVIGLSYYLDRLKLRLQAFLAADDGQGPLGLIDQEAALESGADHAIAKARAIGAILGFLHPGKDLWMSWANGSFLELVGNDAPGWFHSSPYAEGRGPRLMWDQDLDGLPNVLEYLYGLDPDLADSDADGWSDLSEVVMKSDGRVAASTPAGLVADGLFGDWLDMVPGRIEIDLGHQQRCERSSDVTHYGAITTPDRLIVGAVAIDFWAANPDATWEIRLDFPNAGLLYQLSTVTGSHEAVLTDVASGAVIQRYDRTFPIGQTSVEWVFERQTLGLDKSFAETEAVQISIRTVLHRPELVYCDETDWFSPHVSW